MRFGILMAVTVKIPIMWWNYIDNVEERTAPTCGIEVEYRGYTFFQNVYVNISEDIICVT
jgi:hypothetical protein